MQKNPELCAVTGKRVGIFVRKLTFPKSSKVLGDD